MLQLLHDICLGMLNNLNNCKMILGWISVVENVSDTTHMVTSGDGLIIDLHYLCHEKNHDTCICLNELSTYHTDIYKQTKKRGTI